MVIIPFYFLNYILYTLDSNSLFLKMETILDEFYTPLFHIHKNYTSHFSYFKASNRVFFSK